MPVVSQHTRHRCCASGRSIRISSVSAVKVLSRLSHIPHFRFLTCLHHSQQDPIDMVNPGPFVLYSVYYLPVNQPDPPVCPLCHPGSQASPPRPLSSSSMRTTRTMWAWAANCCPGGWQKSSKIYLENLFIDISN